MDKNGDVLGLD